MTAARLLLIAVCAAVFTAPAQVDVALSLDQKQFLPGESIPLKIHIINHSGHTLRLGGDPSWLQVSVEAEKSFVIPRSAALPATPPFDLPPAMMATKEVDLADCYEIARPGRYVATASVAIPEWNQTHSARPRPFDIIRGTKVWERTFGMPAMPQQGGPPEVRKYILQQANYLQSQLRLYVRITDPAEEHTFKVIPLGAIVSFGVPDALLDRQSRLHVLYQSGPRSSTYCVIHPHGELAQREQFEYAGSRPRLMATEDGSVIVRGGVQAARGPVEPAMQNSASENTN